MNIRSGKDYVPDFSFLYGGRASAELLSRWSYQFDPGTAANDSVAQHAWTDPETGLKVTVHLRQLADFGPQAGSAFDWVLTFHNQGAADTPILEAVLPLDTQISIPSNERLRLHYANGSSWWMDDFLPREAEIPPDSRKTLAPLGGYSSHGSFPFMNLQREGGGWVIAVGWSGQWSASFERSATRLHLSAGMERTHLRLHPGEQIRTPRILILPWTGIEAETGLNQLRKLLMACYLPRLGGELVHPPIAHSLMSYYYMTGQAGENLELAAQAKCIPLGVDVHWIDACWYGGQRQWWEEVGSWQENSERFPNGLKKVSDAAHQAGMKFLLWFEPERARPDSGLAREHPEYFLRIPQDENNLLLDLGNPEALQAITDLISARIEEYGVDIYRQDYNFEAVLPYWRGADSPDRDGITEIRNVEGLYTFWDALRDRHPDLWIDNCASGGRRIDLETLSRSLPLWPSDFLETLSAGQNLMVGDQCINAGLARWIPLFGGGVFNFTPYGVRSQIIGGFNFSFHVELDQFPPTERSTIVDSTDVLKKGKSILDDDFPIDQVHEAIEEWRSVRPYVIGDFYLLIPLTADNHDWCAWQFHRPDLHAGVAVLLRRHNSPYPSAEISLREIETQADYLVSVSFDFTVQPERHMKGLELQNWLLTIYDKPGSLLVRYRKA